MTEEQETLPLDRFPVELLLQIFNKVSQRDLLTNVALVCQRFRDIIQDDAYWNTRMREEHEVRVPVVELRHPLYPSATKWFYSIDREKKRWEGEWETQRLITAQGHTATVDSILLFEKNNKTFCLSGSRDRTIRLWDIENVQRGENTQENKWTVAENEAAHTGWIWNIARDEKTENFYSTSWDSTVNGWQITDDGAIRLVNTTRVGSAAQCVSCSGNENEIVCTTFAKKTAVIDTRTYSIVAEHNSHKRAVIGLAVHENNIYTSGEDNLMMMFDRRQMNKPVLFEYSRHSYKTSLSLQRGQLLTSTSDGKVKLHDANNFNVIQMYKVGSFTRQVVLRTGAHFVVARNEEGHYHYMMYTPGVKSKNVLYSGRLAAEPAKFDYSDKTKTLAIGNGDSSILFCVPRADPQN